MAAVSCRAVLAVRWYEVSRVLSVTSTLATQRKFRNETWCRKWWHVSQRSLSISASSFAPGLAPILRKDHADSKVPPKEGKSTTKSAKCAPEAGLTTTSAEAAEVTVTYHRGLPRITVPLPSRKESCMFTLKPITHNVGDFLDMLKTEDRGIDRATVTTIDGTRISSSSTIEHLLEKDFKLLINDNEYTVVPPIQPRHTLEDIQKLSDVQALVGQLYESLSVREYYADMEKEVLAELEDIRLQLEPLEQKLQEIEAAAVRKANLFTWSLLVLMSAQFGALARLTWWEYSWDIMEPVTYFVTYGTAIVVFVYFLLTKQEYMLPDVLVRRQLIALHKRAKKAGLDVNLYNSLKDRAYELESTLKIIRGPLYQHKMQMEQKRRQLERYSSSSSSSRSPSSSPSPSPSPSPERQHSKKSTSSDRHHHRSKPAEHGTKLS